MPIKCTKWCYFLQLNYNTRNVHAKHTQKLEANRNQLKWTMLKASTTQILYWIYSKDTLTLTQIRLKIRAHLIGSQSGLVCYFALMISHIWQMTNWSSTPEYFLQTLRSALLHYRSKVRTRVTFDRCFIDVGPKKRLHGWFASNWQPP